MFLYSLALKASFFFKLFACAFSLRPFGYPISGQELRVFAPLLLILTYWRRVEAKLIILPKMFKGRRPSRTHLNTIFNPRSK